MSRGLFAMLFVTPLLFAIVRFAESGDPPPNAVARQAWRYKVSKGSGWFKKEPGENWIETTPDGGQLWFAETNRTAEYVKLFDTGRILYAGHAAWRQGDDQGWNNLCDRRS